MKFLYLLVLSFSSVTFADVCICQYPTETARFGGGYSGEIGFYKMGCAAWLVSELGCRKEKIIDINASLIPYLDKVLRPAEKIRIGYVGHWGSSSEYVDFLTKEIEPYLAKYKSPIAVDNTACLAMDEAEEVQRYLQSIKTTQDTYMTVSGTQTTSIGMWDKLSIGFRKADLLAFGDSRGLKSVYPSCETFLKKRCTGFQVNEKGYCSDLNGNKKELICLNDIKLKKNQTLKKKGLKWLYADEAKDREIDFQRQAAAQPKK